jgi:hypothetical protein
MLRPIDAKTASSDLETLVADNVNERGPQDRNRINIGQQHEVRYWTKQLGCSEDELRRAVGKVGTSADAVRRLLKDGNGKAPS